MINNKTWELNEKSEYIGQPNELKLELRHHQLCMLYKCLDIEKNAHSTKFPYGIMSDKAGAGKTGVMISLILCDKLLNGETLNLIVVPQNIHTQWMNEFEKFVGDSIKVKSFIDYSDISMLYYDNDVLIENDVLVTTLAYYEMIISISNQVGININRIIFDEIDTLYDVIQSIESKNKIYEAIKKNKKEGDNDVIKDIKNVGYKNNNTWFISASFNNSISDEGFKYNDILISLDEISKIMCKCEDSFVDKSNFELLPPEKIIYYCDDITDLYFDYLSIDQLDYLNSLSFQSIYNINNKKGKDSIECLKIIIDDYYTRYNQIINSKKSIESKINKSGDIKKQYETLSKEEKFYKKILEYFHKSKCEKDCSDYYNCIINEIDKLDITNTKINKLNEILSNIDKTKDKFLIFSDFSGSFNIVSKLLEEKNIKYKEIDGGNIKSINDSVESYKNRDTNVLMIDSLKQGCGMNLENTTHLIFLHKTSEILYNQIIGRAQRPIRDSRLNIYILLNKNEIVDEE